MTRKNWPLFFMALMVFQDSSATDYLFANGRSDYSIILANDASLTERTAAQEMQSVLREIGGVTLPIVTKPVPKGIYIGWNNKTGKTKPQVEDEGFTYETNGSDLFIYGGSERGTMYGVFSFLERELGVHWYTSSYTKLTKMKQYVLGEIRHSETPTIQHRLDFYYDALRHNDWAARNLLNTQNNLANTNHGRMSAYWGMHTFNKLLPPSKYFTTHPEWYSIHEGKRSEKAQLCLSNSQMRLELTKNLMNVIEKNPGYWCYDVSQNDNKLPCECESCKSLVKKYGGQSGLMLWFVNQVANDIRKTYPEVYIGTFAYQYTRQAPTSSIRPANNVVIRLCDIECCMAHPLESCEQNRSFLNDMKAWQEKTKHIYIWDYTTGFRNYLLPFPNFDVLVANYRYFSRSNVIGVLEEGAYNTPWNEFSELKQWLIAKLLWNPHQDVDSLASTFIFDYYGKAATYVWQYYHLCKSQIGQHTHFTINIDSQSPLYDDKFILTGQELMQKAKDAVGDGSPERKRVLRIAAQLYYLRSRRHSIKSAVDGTRNQLEEILDKDPTRTGEHGMTL